MQSTILFRKIFKSFTIITFLYFCLVFQIFDGNSWKQVESNAGETQFFQTFATSDYAFLGLTALADFADLDSSYSLNLHAQSVYANGLRAWPTTCPAQLSGTCYYVNHLQPGGEGNPLITGMFGTKYPTALDYTAWGALELAVQAGIAWALPEDWRKGAWGIFVGIGMADTVMNSYGGGVTFRF
jgi:hypothetical protein